MQIRVYSFLCVQTEYMHSGVDFINLWPLSRRFHSWCHVGGVREDKLKASVSFLRMPGLLHGASKVQGCPRLGRGSGDGKERGGAEQRGVRGKSGEQHRLVV